MDIRELIRSTIVNRNNISDSAWESHGYSYTFRPAELGDGYAINAGCRWFYSFDEFRKHYGIRWLRNWGLNYNSKSRMRYRREALAICDKMEAFANEYNIPMTVKPKRTKKTR